jgi:hypothetical protein
MLGHNSVDRGLRDLRQEFVIPTQAAIEIKPGKSALHHPMLSNHSKLSLQVLSNLNTGLKQ